MNVSVSRFPGEGDFYLAQRVRTGFPDARPQNTEPIIFSAQVCVHVNSRRCL